jgi:hypothetical protein
MSLRIPVSLLVLVAGLTVGLVAVAVVARTPGAADRGAPVARGPSASEPGDPSVLAVLHGWDRQRASAWAAGDPVALASLYVPGSSAGATDVALLRRYAARGLVVRDIRMQVVRARVLVARPRRIELEVTDRLTTATAVRAAGPAAPRRLPAGAAATRVLELRRVGARWLMARVSASAPGR